MLQLNSLKKTINARINSKKMFKKENSKFTNSIQLVRMGNMRMNDEQTFGKFQKNASIFFVMERNEMQNLLNSIHSKTKISKMFLSIY